MSKSKNIHLKKDKKDWNLIHIQLLQISVPLYKKNTLLVASNFTPSITNLLFLTS